MFHRIAHWRIWSHPAVIWLAHAAPAIWLAGAVSLPLLSMASRTDWFPDLIGAPIYYTMLVLLAVAALAQLPHTEAGCTRCAAISKPGTQAPRHVLVAHWTFHHVLIEASPAIALFVASYLIVFPVWVGKIGTIVVLLNLAWTLQAVLLHRWYLPSCPYCKNWGDDPDAPTDVVPPTPPGKSVTL